MKSESATGQMALISPLRQWAWLPSSGSHLPPPAAAELPVEVCPPPHLGAICSEASPESCHRQRQFVLTAAWFASQKKKQPGGRKVIGRPPLQPSPPTTPPRDICQKALEDELLRLCSIKTSAQCFASSPLLSLRQWNSTPLGDVYR